MQVLIALRWWIWSIAVAAPVTVVLFVLATWELYGEETLAEWLFFGVLLFAWAFSAAAGLVTAVALILRHWGSRGAEAVMGMFLSGTSALLFAGALVLAHYG